MGSDQGRPSGAGVQLRSPLLHDLPWLPESRRHRRAGVPAEPSHAQEVSPEAATYRRQLHAQDDPRLPARQQPPLGVEASSGGDGKNRLAEITLPLPRRQGGDDRHQWLVLYCR